MGRGSLKSKALRECVFIYVYSTYASLIFLGTISTQGQQKPAAATASGKLCSDLAQFFFSSGRFWVILERQTPVCKFFINKYGNMDRRDVKLVRYRYICNNQDNLEIPID